jgi:riboflavin kinase/FMN adenylyltransferase
MQPLYTLKGIVVEGNKRGRLLGYPTANVHIKESIPEGVYASSVILSGKEHIAATFIGTSKTFDDPEYKLESYILDFDEDIYGEQIVVEIFKHVRGNIKFDSKETLIQQMQNDVEDIRSFFEKN